DFNRVTKFGACAMRLDVPDASRPDIGFFKRRHNHIGLSFRIWNGVPAGPPAVVDNGALDHAIDIVAVQHSSIQRLQKERANAFSTYISIGVLSKTAAYAVNRERAASLIDIEFGLMEVQVYTAYEGGGTIAGMDRFTGQINGRQAGGTRRIQRQTWPGEIETIGDAIGDAPEKRIGNYLIAGVLLFDSQHLIHRPHRADEHAYVSRLVFPRQDLGVVACVL